MKRQIIILALILAPLTVFGQQKFGHVNSSLIVPSMPEFTQAQTDLQNLQKQYEDDLKRLEDEFTKKSEEYNAQAESLPQNIKERREKELRKEQKRREKEARREAKRREKMKNEE